MAAVTYEYYTGTYLGEPVTEADFPRYEARAEDVIGQVIHFRQVPEQWSTLYKKAVCAQIDYYSVYGIDLTSGGIASNSFTVGKVSVSGPSMNGNSGMTGATSMVAPAARAYLEQTGLMSPQVAVVGEMRPWYWGM